MAKKKGLIKRRKFRKVMVILFLVWLAVGVIQNREAVFSFLLERIGADEVVHSIPVSEEWNRLS